MCFDKSKRYAILKTIYELQQIKVDDTNIFDYDDFKSICEHYIDYINEKSGVCITRHEVISVLSEVLGIDNSTNVTEDFSITFANKILHINALPKNFMELCQKEISSLKIEYSKLIVKLNKIIEIYKEENETTNNEIEKTKKNNKFARFELINELNKYDKKKKSNTLYIEFIKETKKCLRNIFVEIVDIELNTAAKKTALKLMFYTDKLEETVNLHFCYFYSRINIFDHQFDDKAYIPMATKIGPFILATQEAWKNEIEMGKNLDFYKQQCKEYDAIFTEMKSTSKSRGNEYLVVLKKLVNDEFLSVLKNSINKTQTISKRHAIINDALDAYNNKNYDICNSILVVQIEGIVHDILIDTQIVELSNAYTFSNLKEKLQLISTSKNSEIEIIMYFEFFFNQMRNEIAHGGNSYFGLDSLEKEITSLEILLDLNALMFWFCKDSNEYKFKEFISEILITISQTDDEFIFGKFYNELKGTRAHLCPYGIECLNSNIIIFWLFDQYMENLLVDNEDKSNLQRCKNIFCSKSFWEYILKQMKEEILQNSKGILMNLNQDKLETTESFKIAVKKAFKKADEDAKKTLIDIFNLLPHKAITQKL